MRLSREEGTFCEGQYHSCELERFAVLQASEGRSVRGSLKSNAQKRVSLHGAARITGILTHNASVSAYTHRAQGKGY